MGVVMPPDQLQYVRSVLEQAANAPANRESNPKLAEDVKRRLEDLYEKLKLGQISQEIQQQILEFCQALMKGDFAVAASIQTQLTKSSEWNVHKTWLMCFRRFVQGR
eukprot:GHVU01017845.1.p3 GENE.GHVU01017845.1~~GHVU01017845.1.p3  ORF type:complete len:107 (+),score=23.48 GHVU01017845.1:104-424(+)